MLVLCIFDFRSQKKRFSDKTKKSRISTISISNRCMYVSFTHHLRKTALFILFSVPRRPFLMINEGTANMMTHFFSRDALLLSVVVFCFALVVLDCLTFIYRLFTRKKNVMYFTDEKSESNSENTV